MAQVRAECDRIHGKLPAGILAGKVSVDDVCRLPEIIDMLSETFGNRLTGRRVLEKIRQVTDLTPVAGSG